MVPMAFAAWQNIALLAFGISAGLLAVIYMVGFGFGLNEMQMMAKEELVQLIVFGLLLATLVGGDSILNSISTNEGLAQGSATMQDAATLIIDDIIDDSGEIMDQISSYDLQISREASKSSQCSIMGMGYTVSGCGGYTVLAAPLSIAGNIVGFSIGELSAMKRLIQITKEFALNLLLPLGIVLRTVKFTRGAGGLLIALGVALYIMLPAGIIFNEMMAATFLDDDDEFDAELVYGPAAPTANIAECNAGDAASLTTTGNEDNAKEAYRGLRSDIRKYIYTALVRATLGPVISLLLVAASIKAITSLAGAEIDISAISRFV